MSINASTTTTPKKGFDPSSFISMGFDLIGGTLMGISEGKKNRELAEKLQKLSLKQQRELEERLQNIQGEVARQTAMYEAVAVVEKAKLVDSQKTKQKSSGSSSSRINNSIPASSATIDIEALDPKDINPHN